MSFFQHTVLIPTYNHQEYIRQCISSVLENSNLHLKIYVFDDFSTDKTWQYLCEFRDRYPEKFVLSRNTRNLGLFENLNRLHNVEEGDFFHMLSGDDLFSPAMIESIDCLANAMRLDPGNESFIICPRTLFLDPAGNLKGRLKAGFRSLHSFDLLSATIRRLYENRSVGLSRKFYLSLPNYPIENQYIGPWLDFAHDILKITKCENLYIAGFNGPIYREGVGITSKYDDRELSASFQAAVNLIMSWHESGRVPLQNSDLSFLKSISSAR